VDPLVIAGGLGEPVEVLVRDFAPRAGADLPLHMGAELVASRAAITPTSSPIAAARDAPPQQRRASEREASGRRPTLPHVRAARDA
jgi:hypothetical protein